MNRLKWGLRHRVKGSHVEGIYNITTADASHAEGSNNHIIESISHGNNAVAAHVEGENNFITDSISAHAEGKHNTITNANYSHAEGLQNTVTGEMSHAEETILLLMDLRLMPKDVELVQKVFTLMLKEAVVNLFLLILMLKVLELQQDQFHKQLVTL